MVVKAFLVVSVASFHLSVVPRCPRPKQLVLDLQSCTLNVHWMDHPAFLEMSELTSIVCLNDFRKVSEIGNCSVNKIDRRVAADFLIWIDEPFSRRFVDHGILVETLLIRPDITGCWNTYFTSICHLTPGIVGVSYGFKCLDFFLVDGVFLR